MSSLWSIKRIRQATRGGRVLGWSTSVGTVLQAEVLASRPEVRSGRWSLMWVVERFLRLPSAPRGSASSFGRSPPAGFFPRKKVRVGGFHEEGYCSLVTKRGSPDPPTPTGGALVVLCQPPRKQTKRAACPIPGKLSGDRAPLAILFRVAFYSPRGLLD